jgi:hypothetical protein
MEQSPSLEGDTRSGLQVFPALVEPEIPSVYPQKTSIEPYRSFSRLEIRLSPVLASGCMSTINSNTLPL